MDFCSCFLKKLNTIFLVFTDVGYVETKILKSQGPGNVGDLGHPYCGGTISPSAAFCGPRPLCVQYGTQLSESSLGIHNQTPETSARGHGQPTGAGPTGSRGVFMTHQQCWDCFENSSLPLKTSPFGWIWLTHCVALLFRKTSANSHTNSTLHLGCLCRQQKNSTRTQRCVFYNIKWHRISSSKAILDTGCIS